LCVSLQDCRQACLYGDEEIALHTLLSLYISVSGITAPIRAGFLLALFL
jgi:hypothetical protein